MTVDDFIRRFPVLFHMTEAGGWEGIRRHGLLSTSALLDLYGYEGTMRASIESMHRPESVAINHPVLGQAIIRDQKPLNETKLRKCLLDGMKTSDWYRMLNQRVFFWSSFERLIKLINARAYRHLEHDVLTVDSGRLLKKHLCDIDLCSINSGSTFMKAAPRGYQTFCCLIEYPSDRKIVEVAVRGAVRNIEDVVLKVERMQRDTVLKVLWERPAYDNAI